MSSDDTLRHIADRAQGISIKSKQVCAASLAVGAVAKVKVIDDTPVRQTINNLERD